MASVNKVILIGNLGANPELKFLPSGMAVCELRMATTDVYTDKAGQKQERTEWHRVEVWGKQAESCGKYLEKGRQVYVEGQIRTDSWDDKETGQKKYSTKIVARDVRFLGSKGGGGDAGSAPSGGGGAGAGGGGAGPGARPAPRDSGAPPAQPPDFGPGDDDIPF